MPLPYFPTGVTADAKRRLGDPTLTLTSSCPNDDRRLSCPLKDSEVSVSRS
jgi:hypothetical protein